jgi:hypothetical protein|tara:strand:+ start:761 stop:1093 length:333 start_codon:yes stop_codon:yes gene_type:complete
MNISKVLDPEQREESSPLVKGDKITIQGFKLKHSAKFDSDLVEVETTDGLRYTYAKTIVGQGKPNGWWSEQVAKCVTIDASDGLDAQVVERIAEPSGNPMLALETIKPEG